MDIFGFYEKDISKKECLGLFEGEEYFFDILKLADTLRRDIVGDVVTYVVNRNINYTNICVGDCNFCAFKVDKGDKRAYFLNIDEIAKRTLEARKLGCTEVCIQGGLHPDVDTYFQVEILKKIHSLTKPYGGIHIHAFSPMEVKFASENAGLNIKEALKILKENGLNTMPGTAAEILNDNIREELCPSKLSTKDWIEVIKKAHKLGIKTTCTIMYGHIEDYKDIVNHLFILKDIQRETGGFTEFVPLSFMYKRSPIYLKGRARSGATGIDDLKMYAISRILFKEVIKNIQVSWVKLGIKMAQISLKCGANDFGGTLMEENISKSAGAEHGVNISVENIRNTIINIGRIPKERNTLYDILE
ncbi:5-amino-6-(D-ribitylamino)uracil--L-tyrosine 4-hydroxyphenyl transferase CofH [Methanothermococcus sp. SCGC AD-155-C09]|nr:5-amino-6-(D-ribitylamino)uracil--L-tyrosine 4-hydroxyphenyl transferase CofH [Methanothermococcus sp. SCGC AD-155-C09]